MHIVIDTETTGLDPRIHGLVEIAAVAGDPLQSSGGLCNPGVPVPPEASAVHHIVDSDLEGKPSPAELFSEIMSSLPVSKYMVAHNAEVDKSFLARAWPAVADMSWICTYRCALHLWPEAPSHSNQVLRYWLGTRPELPNYLYPHRALYDAVVTESILREMLRDHTHEELCELTTRPAILRKVRFGKHRDMLWSEVPRDYLWWVLNKSGMDDRDVIHTARHWLGGGM